MEKQHPIGDLMATTMQKIREIADVNTIIGDIIESDSGVTVIPVSKVSCGFFAGGGEYAQHREKLPFLGGSGAGLNVQPVGFLVIHGEQIRLIPVCGATPLDKAIEAVPLIAEQLQNLLDRNSGCQ